MKLKIQWTMTLAFFLVSLSSVTTQGASKYTLHQWNHIANLFRVVAHEGENQPEQPLARYCNLTAAVAQDRLVEVQAEIDALLKQDEIVLKKPLEILKRAQGCELKCHCGIYSELLEKLEPGALKGLGSRDRGQIKSIHHAASTQTPQQAASCARKNTGWICSSDFVIKGI